MTFQFRDILQATSGPFKGALAQVTAVSDSEIGLFYRSDSGMGQFLKVPQSDWHLWKMTGGQALIGPPQKTIQPGAAPELLGSGRTAATEVPASPDAAPVPPLNPLDVVELLAPLPADTKAVPMNSDGAAARTSPSPLEHEVDGGSGAVTPVPAVPSSQPAPTWNMDEPEPTPEQRRTKRIQQRQKKYAANPMPRLRYRATVTNGAGQQVVVEYDLRKGIDPDRFKGIAVRQAQRKQLTDVKPYTVENIHRIT